MFDEWMAFGLNRKSIALQTKAAKLFLERICNDEVSSKDYIYDPTKPPVVITPRKI